MAEPQWRYLPLLPLKCVLDYLSLEDALAATSVCRGWRMGLLLYEGRRDTLKLNTKDLDKCVLLARIFRRRARKLQVIVDCERQLDNFMHSVIPKFFDTMLLDIQFIGPDYLSSGNNTTIILRRPITESLINSHRNVLKNLSLNGCVIEPPREFEEYENKMCSMTKVNLKTSMLYSLQQMSLDYHNLDPELFEGLSTLPNLRRLSLTVRDSKGQYQPLPWHVLDKQYPSQIQVTVNIVRVPLDRFEEIIDNILVDGLPLAALRVMFCRTLHGPFIVHIITLYNSTLKELHWADSLYLPSELKTNTNIPCDLLGYDSSGINPFILVCWRCTHLESLVIHGYSISVGDCVGMSRLRGDVLRTLCISSLSHDESKPATKLTTINVPRQEINHGLQFKFQPIRKLSSIHPALRPKSTDEEKADYILKYALDSYDLT